MPLFELPIENNRMGGGGGGGGESGGVWTVLLSEVTLFEYNISTILSPTCLFRSCHLDIC